MIQDLRVQNCIYHRNGISGIGFWAVEFSYSEDEKTHNGIATVDDDDVQRFKKQERCNPGTRIIMLRNHTPRIEETMRGDKFHTQLCEIIVEREKSWQNQ